MTVTFDAGPLVQPITAEELRGFRATPVGRASTEGGTAGRLMLSVALLLGVFVALSGAVTFMIRRTGAGTGVILVVVALMLGALIGLGAYRVRRRAAETAYRLSLFAAANSMQFAGTVAEPPLPGMIFRIGSDRSAFNVVRGRTPRFAEFGDYRYTTGSGKDRRVHTWGYIAVRIDNLLPNIVLDSTGNNTFLGSNLPASLAQAQRLRLEGDFDRHFTLYAPEGYERDALYLFTPDVMQAFMSTVGAFDVEIVDNWVFFYTDTRIDRLASDGWTWQFQAVQALLAKIDQWERWRDDRLITANSAPGSPLPLMTVPAPLGVAPSGRRLRRGVSWAWIGGVVLILGWWLVQFVMKVMV